MKRIFPYLFLTIILIATTLHVYAQNVIWAKGCKLPLNGGFNEVIGSVMDRDGNSYTAGYFYGSANFDSITLSSPSKYSIFVAKYSPEGKVINVFRSIGSGHAQLDGICIDQNDNLVLLGNFEGFISIGGVSISGNIGISSYFIARMNTSGSAYWVKTLNNYFTGIGSFYNIRTKSITCDKANNIYIYGYVGGSYSLDGILLNAANGNIFFAKLNPTTGGAIWARQIKSPSNEIFPRYIFADYNNNVLISGRFDNTNIIFNNTDTLNLTGLSHKNAFMAKYDQSGTYIWAKNLDSLMEFTNAAIDTNNNIYVVGRDYAGSPVQSNYGKYDQSGNRIWFNHLNFFAYSICNNRNSNFLIAKFTSSFNYMGYTFTSPDGELIFKTDISTGALTWHSQSFTVNNKTIYANDRGVIQISGNCIPISHIRDYLFLEWGGFVSLLHDSDFSPLANNTIHGNIYNDTDYNCTRTYDPSMNGIPVVAFPGPYYAVSDSFGNYSLKVDTGTFTIKELAIHTHTFKDSVHCPPGSYIVSMSSTGMVDTGYDFQNEYTICSFLDINSLNSNHLSFCDTNISRTFNICNYGKDTARNAKLTIKYPTEIFSPISCSSTPYSYDSASQMMTVWLGDILSGSCLSVTVTDSVACTSPPYYTSYGFKLRVTPVNSCISADSIFNSDTVQYHIVPKENNVPNTNAKNRELRIFPNPTTGEVFVSGLSNAKDLEVHNIIGSKVFAKRDNLGEIEKIDLTAMPIGIYIISANTNEGLIVIRISKI